MHGDDYLHDDHCSDTVDYLHDRERVRSLVRAVERRDARILLLEEKLERARALATNFFEALCAADGVEDISRADGRRTAYARRGSSLRLRGARSLDEILRDLALVERRLQRDDEEVTG